MRWNVVTSGCGPRWSCAPSALCRAAAAAAWTCQWAKPASRGSSTTSRCFEDLRHLLGLAVRALN
eukprot:6675111-Lingulodinium_polyedra.AAC.1